MKKILITVTAVFYLAITSGLAMNIHYCMGKISSVSFGSEGDHSDGTCNKCGMNKTENHCCNDEFQFVKLTDSHQSSGFSGNIQLISIELPVTEVSLTTSLQGHTIEPFISYSSPPPLYFNEVYKAVRVFRI